ncbi:MAG: enoyl-CoA hydratase-related protein [Pseudomonadota bacterium]
MWKIENEGFVRTLTLDRLEAMNALSPAIITELIEILEQTGQDDSVRVLIMTGKDKIFSSGMDVKALANPSDPEIAHMFNYSVPKMFNAFIDFPKPLIMAVNGMGVGWGATVLGHADLVIMAENAKLKCPFSSLAVVPEACSTEIFPRFMGHQKAFWLLLSGEWFNAEQCLDAGLAFEVVPDEDLLSIAMQRAQTLAAAPRVALVSGKALLKAPHRDASRRANREEMDRFIEILEHPACKEGISAFFEKRRADYSRF